MEGAQKVGEVADTRETVPVWAYVIVYRVTDTEVQILRVWRGVQERPAD